ncbi:MAG: helix-turn-helix domain-containing protein [Bdellovibrionales bacterium]|nr:helix-turn-helix domain-containing protein [Bdellovibrionales bacterium]
MSRDSIRYRANSSIAVVSDCSAKKSGNNVTSNELFFESSRWLTAKEAADYLGLASVGVLRNWVSQGRVRFYKLGRSLRFRISDLDLLIRPAFQIGRFRV